MKEQHPERRKAANPRHCRDSFWPIRESAIYRGLHEYAFSSVW
jgi:hypothetical protein